MPLYLGLIVAQGVYVWHFWVELVHLVGAATNDPASMQAIVTAILAPQPGATPARAGPPSARR